jgi:hypothetical protein
MSDLYDLYIGNWLKDIPYLWIQGNTMEECKRFYIFHMNACAVFNDKNEIADPAVMTKEDYLNNLFCIFPLGGKQEFNYYLKFIFPVDVKYEILKSFKPPGMLVIKDDDFSTFPYKIQDIRIEGHTIKDLSSVNWEQIFVNQTFGKQWATIINGMDQSEHITYPYQFGNKFNNPPMGIKNPLQFIDLKTKKKYKFNNLYDVVKLLGYELIPDIHKYAMEGKEGWTYMWLLKKPTGNPYMETNEPMISMILYETVIGNYPTYPLYTGYKKSRIYHKDKQYTLKQVLKQAKLYGLDNDIQELEKNIALLKQTVLKEPRGEKPTQSLKVEDYNMDVFQRIIDKNLYLLTNKDLSYYGTKKALTEYAKKKGLSNYTIKKATKELLNMEIGYLHVEGWGCREIPCKDNEICNIRDVKCIKVFEEEREPEKMADKVKTSEKPKVSREHFTTKVSKYLYLIKNVLLTENQMNWFNNQMKKIKQSKLNYNVQGQQLLDALNDAKVFKGDFKKVDDVIVDDRFIATKVPQEYIIILGKNKKEYILTKKQYDWFIEKVKIIQKLNLPENDEYQLIVQRLEQAVEQEKVKDKKQDLISYKVYGIDQQNKTYEYEFSLPVDIVKELNLRLAIFKGKDLLKRLEAGEYIKNLLFKQEYEQLSLPKRIRLQENLLTNEKLTEEEIKKLLVPIRKQYKQVKEENIQEYNYNKNIFELQLKEIREELQEFYKYKPSKIKVDLEVYEKRLKVWIDELREKIAEIKEIKNKLKQILDVEKEKSKQGISDIYRRIYGTFRPKDVEEPVELNIEDVIEQKLLEEQNLLLEKQQQKEKIIPRKEPASKIDKPTATTKSKGKLAQLVEVNVDLEEIDYQKLTDEQLRKELEKRKLNKVGNRQILIKRLINHDMEKSQKEVSPTGIISQMKNLEKMAITNQLIKMGLNPKKAQEEAEKHIEADEESEASADEEIEENIDDSPGELDYGDEEDEMNLEDYEEY